MTIPQELYLPLQTEELFNLEGEDQVRYWKELLNTLTDRDREVVNIVNGVYEYVEEPTISGASTAGAGTYTNREAWYLRQAIMVDYWFDITWTNHTGTGNLVLDLPYLVINSQFEPFVGVIEQSSLTLTGGYTWLTVNCQPNTSQALIIENGSGNAAQALAIPTSGRIAGHVRYIGKGDQSI